MRETIKSMIRFSWSMSLFGMRQMWQALASREREPGGAAESFDAVTKAARRQLQPPFAALFERGDGLQREVIDRMLGGPAPAPTVAPPAFTPPPVLPPRATVPQGGSGVSPRPAAPALRPVSGGRLDRSRLVILGDGLAAGMGDFSLHAPAQEVSFAAWVARQMQADLPLPLFEPPGIGEFPGFQSLPVRVPGLMQTTVLESFPPGTAWGNLAVPGFTLADVLERRPGQPLVRRDDWTQTAANLILGLPDFLRGGDAPLPTQLEAALRRSPSVALVALGYDEVLEGALQGDADRLPRVESFRSGLSRLLSTLRQSGAEVVVATVPDPMDTPGFSDLHAAARVLKVAPSLLATTYGLQDDDRLTAAGLFDVAFQLRAGAARPLSSGSAVCAAVAAQVGERVRHLNGEIAAVAAEQDASVADLHGVVRRLRLEGLSLQARHLTADFLGGLYTLNGCYPGATAHAALANEVLALLDRVYGADFPPVDLDTAAGSDPVASYQAPEGPDLPLADLPFAPPPAPLPEPEPRSGRGQGGGSAGSAAPLPVEKPGGPLRLPASLEQILPLCKAASYHGDAIRVVDCSDPKDVRFGSCGGVLFGGLVLFDSHLTGSIRIRFNPPVDGVAHFEVTLVDALAGDDGVLSAPQLFRWPVLQIRVEQGPGGLASGDLHLETGEVTNLQLAASYVNSALFALARVNPGFPAQAIAFPGAYGSAWARFDQRPDGQLDFTCHGTTFLPLGGDLGGYPVRWALPFASATQQFASIPARGLALHPHLHLSTREPEGGAETGACLDLPANTVRELLLYTRNSSFGDLFTLEVPELGGMAKGRSHLMGRLQLQLGERFGDALPVALSLLPPGGMLAPLPESPLSADFPGRLAPGGIGHDEFLRFPLRTFFLDSVALLGDPFDLAVGAVDLKTGHFIDQLLHRGFIGQNLFFALVRIEPRTPRSSFFFQGPARFERGAGGEAVLRYQGEVHIPYPEGFLFPAPDLASGFVAGAGSSLDPYLWLHAVEELPPHGLAKAGAARDVVSSTGQRFSYEYSIPGDPQRGAARFEYTNHTQQGTFRLDSLTWAGFLGPRGSSGEPETVSFAGFGRWSLDSSGAPHLVTVQVSTPPRIPYVSIQVDGGRVSNVNTKPVEEKDALP